MRDALFEKCREVRDLEAKLRGIANVFDRGGDTSGEQEVSAQLHTAQSAALEEAQRRVREEGRAWLEDMKHRLELLASRPGTERLTANVVLPRLASLDAAFPSAYADAVELLHQHRRFLDAVSRANR